MPEMDAGSWKDGKDQLRSQALTRSERRHEAHCTALLRARTTEPDGRVPFRRHAAACGQAWAGLRGMRRMACGMRRQSLDSADAPTLAQLHDGPDVIHRQPCGLGPLYLDAYLDAAHCGPTVCTTTRWGQRGPGFWLTGWLAGRTLARSTIHVPRSAIHIHDPHPRRNGSCPALAPEPPRGKISCLHDSQRSASRRSCNPKCANRRRHRRRYPEPSNVSTSNSNINLIPLSPPQLERELAMHVQYVY